ncbi:MAG: single-stranded-DNA-specific exonuclease RecJ [Rickettsiales bacterium]|nr:single-stranded-DNA-specific exonuclease RecJ [Rickettsiales bacterium]
MEEELGKKSVKGFHWLLNKVEQEKVNQFIQKLDVSEIIARLLVGRDISLKNAPQFLSPTLRDSMPDPFHLLDMEKGTQIIVDAILNKQKIVIFGDYDVDGATSSAVLKRFFALLGLDVSVYIPDRITEGYGPSIKAFTKLKEEGAELIITVDCGTASVEAIEYGVNNDLKVVVVDHHLSGDELPPAHAVINPNRKDETSEYGCLAAVGVAFLLAVAVTSILRKKEYFKAKQEPQLMKLLDIVAIGTICDVVPLESINRAFVTQGLKILNQRQNPGVQAFCQLLNLENELTPYHLGYIMGPRINAGGRVGESFLGSKLLSTDNFEEASEIVNRLELYNSERKAIEHSVYEQALEQAKLQSPDDALIMVSGENWHPGVVGIVAGRLKEAMHKPVAVLSLDGENAKASCRSVYGVDFGSAIVKAKEEGIVIGGGGHKMAAGFTGLQENIPAIKAFLHNRFTEELSKLKGKDNRSFEGYLSSNAVNLELAKQIERIGPFGPSNHEPKFVLKNVYISRTNVFADSHINCFIGCNETKNLNGLLKANAFRAIGTDMGDALLSSVGKTLDLVGYIKINRWKGRETPEFSIEDVILH